MLTAVKVHFYHSSNISSAEKLINIEKQLE